MKIIKINIIIFTLLIIANTNITNAKTNLQSHIERTGDYIQVMIPTYALGLTMSEDGYEGAKQFTYSFLSTQATTEILKRLTQRKRPDFKISDKKNSFPSGHTAAAFSGATFIHKRYGIRKAIIPYTLATFVGFSRVYADKHHTTDVLAGAIISSLYSIVFTEKYNKVNVSSDGTGIAVNYKTNF